MNHVQSVNIIAMPPADVRRFLGIYPSGLRPSRYIPKNLLHSRWYITDIHLLAMVYTLHIAHIIMHAALMAHGKCVMYIPSAVPSVAATTGWSATVVGWSAAVVGWLAAVVGWSAAVVGWSASSSATWQWKYFSSPNPSLSKSGNQRLYISFT